MKIFACISIGICLAFHAAGQEIPLNTWRTHFSYNSIISMAESPNRIFVSAEVGLFAVDKSDGAIQRFSVSDGFQDVDVSVVYFEATSGILMVGYRSGNLDLVVDGSVVNFDLISDSQVIGSKSINDITAVNSDAYIATDYGILKFDLARAEIRETYRELGEDASQIRVNEVAIVGDSIFAATEVGIQSANFSGNDLSSFTSWNRYAEFDREVTALASANDRLYSLSGGKQYEYNLGSWEEFLPSSGFEPLYLKGSREGLLLMGGSKVEVMNGEKQVIRTIDSPDLEEAVTALSDSGGRLWIGDLQTGLWAETGAELEYFSPSGPERTVPFRLAYTDKEIVALPGGFDSQGRPLGNDFGYSTFDAGEWENLALEDFGDVTSAAGLSGRLYLGSAGDGVLDLTEGIKYDETNSPLTDTGEGVVIPDIAFDGRDLYVLNLGAPEALLRLDGNGMWQPFLMPTVARSATQLEASSGYAWMVVPANRGGGIYAAAPESGAFRYLSDEANNGGLPSRIVGDVALDQEGFLWIGTRRGITVWFTPFQLTGEINTTEPVFEGRPLLVDQEVYAIAVDGGNRKWFGTDQGAWLFDPFADDLLLHFTRENSPLPSDVVRDIVINEKTGEVFFLTDAGMASYRADATESTDRHSDVKIFPNPVESQFQGEVAISGLVQDAYVRITDSAGQLVYETRANGGTATWPVRQFPGGTVASGMYFVFSVSADGSETYVGKIAVIR